MKDIPSKTREILKNNCVSYDDFLKNENHTCYTIQKTEWDGKYFKQVNEAFLKLGYKPEVQSEDEDFITYMLPD